MDERIQHALARDRTTDITTRGRNTGQLRRTEIWFHNIDGQVYITGSPGRRDWYANLAAHPEFILHLRQTVKADLPARATPILDMGRRLAIIASIHQTLGGSRDLDATFNRWTTPPPDGPGEYKPEHEAKPHALSGSRARDSYDGQNNPRRLLF